MALKGIYGVFVTVHYDSVLIDIFAPLFIYFCYFRAYGSLTCISMIFNLPLRLAFVCA